MNNSEFDITEGLDRFIYITITEVALNHSKTTGFMSTSSWCRHTRNYIMSASDLIRVVSELDAFYSILSDIYSLNNTEATTYIISYFKHELWTRFLPLVEARRRYFGVDFYSIK
jgi:hypothetical protein